MIALFIISIITSFAYIAYILFKFGVPVSLSETFYILPNKQKWLFSAFCTSLAVMLGIYWFYIAPPSLKWIAVVCAVALLFVTVSCDYKSQYDSKSIVKGSQHKNKRTLKEILESFSLKKLFSNGWAKPLHYANSILLIILSTIYICIVNPNAIIATVLNYIVFVVIGLKVDGVYNKLLSSDLNNSAAIFFGEIVCILHVFIFLPQL